MASTWITEGNQARRMSRKGVDEGDTPIVRTAWREVAEPHNTPRLRRVPCARAIFLVSQAMSRFRHPFRQSPLHAQSLLPSLPAEHAVCSLSNTIHPKEAHLRYSLSLVWSKHRVIGAAHLCESACCRTSNPSCLDGYLQDAALMIKNLNSKYLYLLEKL